MRKVSGWLLAVGLVLAAAPVPGNADESWTLVKATSFRAAADRSARASVLTVDPTRADVRIMSVPLELGIPAGSGDHSLRILARHLESTMPRRSSWVLVNGGFSSSREDIPVGLLVVDGKVYSRLSSAKGSSTPLFGTSAFSTYRWSGILCQDRKGGKWDIVPAANYVNRQCYQALQAGPVLVEPGGKIGIAATEPQRSKPYSRTAVCLSDGLLRFVVVKDPTHLYPLARWLSASERSGGLGCRVALNLSGESSSGMVQRTPSRQGLVYLGDGTFPIPSALIIEERRR
jgi:uncharacterized protein YigE (DUF2233 family)